MFPWHTVRDVDLGVESGVQAPSNLPIAPCAPSDAVWRTGCQPAAAEHAGQSALIWAMGMGASPLFLRKITSFKVCQVMPHVQHVPAGARMPQVCCRVEKASHVRAESGALRHSQGEYPCLPARRCFLR